MGKADITTLGLVLVVALVLALNGRALLGISLNEALGSVAFTVGCFYFGRWCGRRF